MYRTLPPLVIVLCIATSYIIADIPRPRGVSVEKASLYEPQDDLTWVCLDGKKTIKITQINDDYCDCADGSDEPGTSACPLSFFHCENIGYLAQEIPASRVNDGVCDCCDTSDEYASDAKCENICERLGQAERELRRSRAELHKKGSEKRSEFIAKGKQLKTERDNRRLELERRRAEQDILKAEKEELKRKAETLESEALELYKEIEREEEEPKIAEPQSVRVEAEANFLFYDKNKDGFIEVTELQVDMRLDKNRDGVVTIEEAKYFLDERDRIDLESFITLSWPRIKPIQMLAEGLFKPPTEEAEDNEQAEVVEDSKKIEPKPVVHGTEPEHADQEADVPDAEELDDQNYPEDEEEVEEEEEEEPDTGVGSAVNVDEKSSTPPEYDPETQRLIELANEARNAYSDVERQLREIEQEIKDIDEQNSKDYGPEEEFAAMDGECFIYEDREYVYTLCPFDRAAQKQRSGGAETTLGRWDQWLPDENGYKYFKQKYAHGASCWNGPQRSAIVQLKCALESRIISVSEPNRCEYFFEFETPAACDNSNDSDKIDVHDEL